MAVASHALRPADPVLRPGRGVTRPREGQPCLGVSSLDCRSSIVGSGPFGSVPAQSRCRATRRCVSQHICLSGEGLAGPSFARLRSIIGHSRPVASRTLSNGALVSCPGRFAGRFLSAALPFVVHEASAPSVDKQSTTEQVAWASTILRHFIQRSAAR